MNGEQLIGSVSEIMNFIKNVEARKAALKKDRDSFKTNIGHDKSICLDFIKNNKQETFLDISQFKTITFSEQPKTVSIESMTKLHEAFQKTEEDFNTFFKDSIKKLDETLQKYEQALKDSGMEILLGTAKNMIYTFGY